MFFKSKFTSLRNCKDDIKELIEFFLNRFSFEPVRFLSEALTKVKTLSGLLPICATFHKIRDDKGYWNRIDRYIQDNSEVRFSHGICPDCFEKQMEELEKED